PARMLGCGSPSRKLSCSVNPSTAPPYDRPCVLFSALRVPLRKGHQGPNDRALRTLWRVRAIAVEPERAGDVEVRPFGAVLDRRVQKGGGLDRPAFASSGVPNVRHLSFDLVAVLVGERHRPETVTGFH